MCDFVTQLYVFGIPVIFLKKAGYHFDEVVIIITKKKKIKSPA